MAGCPECVRLLLDDPNLRVVPWDRAYEYIDHMNMVHNAGFKKPKKEGPGFERWNSWEAPNGRSRAK